MPPLNALGKVSALALVPEPAQVVVTLTHAAVNHCRREACLWVRCFVPPQRRQQVEHFFATRDIYSASALSNLLNLDSGTIQ